MNRTITVEHDGVTYDATIALIDSAFLGVEDHGILTTMLGLDLDGGGHIGVGGYAMDSYDKQAGRRVGTAYGCDLILRLLEVVGVSQWADIRGRTVLALTTEATGHVVLGLASLRTDTVLILSEHAKTYFPEETE